MAKFSELINNDHLTLIDFHAEWCGPCKMMAPILKRVKDHLGDKVIILKIDVDKNQQLAERYQVRGVPMLMLFKNGALLWKQPGVISEENIIAKINSNI